MSLNLEVLDPNPTGLLCEGQLELAFPTFEDFVLLAVRFTVVVVRFVLLHGRKEADLVFNCVGLGLEGGDISDPLVDPESSSSEPLLPLSILLLRLIRTLGLGLGDCLLWVAFPFDDRLLDDVPVNFPLRCC